MLNMRRAWPSGQGARLARRKSRVRLPPGAHVRTIFRSNRPGYPHPVSSELEKSDIRVALGDCSITERWRWRPPYQTGKTVHVHAKQYKYNSAGCVRQWFPTAETLGERRYENWNTHTHTIYMLNVRLAGDHLYGK